jgi:hypothetical protein
VLLCGGAFYWYYTNLKDTSELAPVEQSISIEKKNIQEETDVYRISVEYPVLQGNYVDGANSLIKSRIEKSMSDFKGFVQESDGMNITDLSKDIKNELTTKYEVMYESNELVSIKFETFSYARGSAHPMTLYSGFSYLLGEEREVTISGLFSNTENVLSELSTKAEEKLKTMLGEMYMEDFAKTGLEPKEENFKDFYVSKDGITFIFNVYQVAPYAAGPQFIFFPWSEISNAVNL